MKNKKGYSEEECVLRMKAAFEKKGLDYEAYLRHLEEKRHPVVKGNYVPNHEDNVQFGCCSWDVLDTLDNSTWF